MHSSDPIVAAIDRATQAQYRLMALIEVVENAIYQEKERIRATIAYDSNIESLSESLLLYLRQGEQGEQEPWRQIVLQEVISLLDIRQLTRNIWVELLSEE